MAVSGVTKAAVTLEPPHGEVEHDGSATVDALIAALDEEGYSAKPRV